MSSPGRCVVAIEILRLRGCYASLRTHYAQNDRWKDGSHEKLNRCKLKKSCFESLLALVGCFEDPSELRFVAEPIQEGI